jgi:hypothetical protein
MNFVLKHFDTYENPLQKINVPFSQHCPAYIYKFVRALSLSLSLSTTMMCASYGLLSRQPLLIPFELLNYAWKPGKLEGKIFSEYIFYIFFINILMNLFASGVGGFVRFWPPKWHLKKDARADNIYFIHFLRHNSTAN